MKLNNASILKLRGVHPDLKRVVLRCAELIPEGDFGFVVTEGERTKERQTALRAAGASKTMKSRHIPDCNRNGFACAVDLAVTVQGSVRWDWPLYDRLALHMRKAALKENVPIEWGGEWKMRDGPHYQLPWDIYK